MTSPRVNWQSCVLEHAIRKAKTQTFQWGEFTCLGTETNYCLKTPNQRELSIILRNLGTYSYAVYVNHCTFSPARKKKTNRRPEKHLKVFIKSTRAHIDALRWNINTKYIYMYKLWPRQKEAYQVFSFLLKKMLTHSEKDVNVLFTEACFLTPHTGMRWQLWTRRMVLPAFKTSPRFRSVEVHNKSLGSLRRVEAKIIIDQYHFLFIFFQRCSAQHYDSSLL